MQLRQTNKCLIVLVSCNIMMPSLELPMNTPIVTISRELLIQWKLAMQNIRRNYQKWCSSKQDWAWQRKMTLKNVKIPWITQSLSVQFLQMPNTKMQKSLLSWLTTLKLNHISNLRGFCSHQLSLRHSFGLLKAISLKMLSMMSLNRTLYRGTEQGKSTMKCLFLSTSSLMKLPTLKLFEWNKQENWSLILNHPIPSILWKLKAFLKITRYFLSTKTPSKAFHNGLESIWNIIGLRWKRRVKSTQKRCHCKWVSLQMVHISSTLMLAIFTQSITEK